MYNNVQDLHKSYTYIVLTVIIANLLLGGYVFFKTHTLSVLKQQLSENYVNQIQISQTLAMLQTDMGYLGFIHHFKNYVIRRDDQYFQKAKQSYRNVKQHVQKLYFLVSDVAFLKDISIVELTADEYYEKLLMAKEKGTRLSTAELDKLVKVDDIPALNAILRTHHKVLPEVNRILDVTEDQVSKLTTSMWIFNIFLVPIVFFSTWFILRVVRKTNVYAEELGEIFNLSPDGILYIDNEGNILGANKMVSEIFEYTNKELKRLKVEDLIDPNIKDKHIQLRHQFQSQQQSRVMTDRKQRIQGKTKSQIDVEVQIAISSTIVDDKPRTICVIRDMREHNELKETAELDYLTNLYNRRSIDKIVFNEITRADRQKSPVSLILIDLDNFKQVNDEKGHDAGDQVLSQVARFLQEHTRNYDSVCRWGGDEFVIVSPGMSEKDVTNYANRLIESFQHSPVSDGLLNFSIGISTHTPKNPYDADSLFRHADQALYHSKNAGKGQATHINDMDQSEVKSKPVNL